jgi:sulfate transport system permease protein
VGRDVTTAVAFPERAVPRASLGDRLALAATTLAIGCFIALPLVSVVFESLRRGLPAALATFGDPYARDAIALSVIVAAVTVTANTAFGVLAAWTLAKYRFPGKAVLLAIIDLPLTVSPVVAGLAILLCFGAQAPLGVWLGVHGVKVAFALPGIVLATTFVTFPYVARETLALLTESGRDLEEAAIGLGATVWQTLWRVTLPRARWAILNGVLLCNARALGEFGAVSVISGRIRGLTDTVPLEIANLYDESNFVGAFTLAAALATVAIALTLARSTIDARRRVSQE